MHRWLPVLLLMSLLVGMTHAQAGVLDTLPPCDFTPLNDDSEMRVGAVVYDFTTQRGCSQSLDDVFSIASVPKLFVAGAYYDWMLQGLVRLNTEMTFTSDYWMGGTNDCLRQEDIGTRYSGRDLLEKMINCSDNAATWMLMDSVGWLTVNNYIQAFGIPGIGEVLPYSEVDRLKLSMLDAAWSAVPRGLAARYYRAGLTGGLERYLTSVPTERLTRQQEVDANSDYFLLYSANTASPRAIATYFMQLREALVNEPNSQRGLIARLLFDTMQYTQRLNSVQALDGTVLVAGKNGFDMGVVAEVNMIFDAAQLPTGMVIVFTQQGALTSRGVQPPSPTRGPLNAYIRNLSASIAQILYPAAPLAPLVNSLNLSSVTLQTQSAMESCWQNYRLSDLSETLVDSVENCFRSYTPQQRFQRGDNVSFGMVLRGLNGADTRLVFVYTAPNGERYSYQTDRNYQDKTAIYWYHPIDQAGEWQLDIYLNFQRISRQTFYGQ